LTPTREGVLVVDQRAAHLRVLYETALHNLKNEPADAQRLLFSHTVDLPAADAELFEELKPDLRALGFDVERLSGRTVAVRGVPPSVSADEEREALEGVLEQYKTDPGSVGRETKKRLAQSLAQQQAVRRGQPLAPDEQRALLQDLFACEMPYADPQGRPTTWRLSMEEIAKQFDR
jgi:DNA mismatch repair protein MutL